MLLLYPWRNLWMHARAPSHDTSPAPITSPGTTPLLPTELTKRSAESAETPMPTRRGWQEKVKAESGSLISTWHRIAPRNPER